MKQSNVLRFVSLRPPVPIQEDSPRHVSEPKAETEFGDKLRRAGRNYEGLPDEARSKVGTDFIESDQYFTNTPAWAKWRTVETLAHGAVSPNSGLNSLRDLLVRLTDIINRLELDATPDSFVESPQVSAFQLSVWRSYFSVNLAPDLRPQDHERLTNWIRFFHLATSASAQSRFDEVAPIAHRVRPNLPFEMFATERTEPDADEPLSPIGQFRERRTALAVELESAKKARIELRQLQARKTAEATRRTGEADPVRHAAAVSKTTKTAIPQEGADARKLLERGQIAPVEHQATPPWRLAPVDLSERPNLAKYLSHLEIETEIETIPSILTQLTRRIATLIAEIAAIDRRIARERIDDTAGMAAPVHSPF